jgi:hypothetical protein
MRPLRQLRRCSAALYRPLRPPLLRPPLLRPPRPLRLLRPPTRHCTAEARFGPTPRPLRLLRPPTRHRTAEARFGPTPRPLRPLRPPLLRPLRPPTRHRTAEARFGPTPRPLRLSLARLIHPLTGASCRRRGSRCLSGFPTLHLPKQRPQALPPRCRHPSSVRRSSASKPLKRPALSLRLILQVTTLIPILMRLPAKSIACSNSALPPSGVAYPKHIRNDNHTSMRNANEYSWPRQSNHHQS